MTTRRRRPPLADAPKRAVARQSRSEQDPWGRGIAPVRPIRQAEEPPNVVKTGEGCAQAAAGSGREAV